MNRKLDILITSAAAAFATGVVVSIMHNYHDIKMRQIQVEGAAETARIKKAAGIVTQRIKLGCYDGKTTDDIWSDYEFYKQVTDVT